MITDHLSPAIWRSLEAAGKKLLTFILSYLIYDVRPTLSSLTLCRSNYRNSQVGLKRGRVTKGDTYDANNIIRSNRGRWRPGAANFSWSHPMVKIYEVAYSEHTVYHKRFKAEDEDAAIEMARNDLEKHSWDVNKAKNWEHGSGEGGQFEVVDELNKEDEDDLDD